MLAAGVAFVAFDVRIDRIAPVGREVRERAVEPVGLGPGVPGPPEGWLTLALVRVDTPIQEEIEPPVFDQIVLARRDGERWFRRQKKSLYERATRILSSDRIYTTIPNFWGSGGVPVSSRHDRLPHI